MEASATAVAIDWKKLLQGGAPSQVLARTPEVFVTRSVALIAQFIDFEETRREKVTKESCTGPR